MKSKTFQRLLFGIEFIDFFVRKIATGSAPKVVHVPIFPCPTNDLRKTFSFFSPKSDHHRSPHSNHTQVNFNSIYHCIKPLTQTNPNTSTKLYHYD